MLYFEQLFDIIQSFKSIISGQIGYNRELKETKLRIPIVLVDSTSYAGQYRYYSRLFCYLLFRWIDRPIRVFCSSSVYIDINNMANKQLVGTGTYVTETQINLKIPVQQSFLPVQNIKEPIHELPKELIYSNDARNPHFEMKMTCSDGKKGWEKRVEFSKEQMASFFQQLEKIQDQLNSYQ